MVSDEEKFKKHEIKEKEQYYMHVIVPRILFIVSAICLGGMIISWLLDESYWFIGTMFGTALFFYKLTSPLLRIYYYADEKYNLSERRVTEKELAPIVDELIPRIVEDSIRETFAEKYGLRESVVEAKDYDIDCCLLKFKKPQIAMEVKWKTLDKTNIVKSEETLNKIDAPRKILFVQDKTKIKSHLELFDVNDLMGLRRLHKLKTKKGEMKTKKEK